MHSFNTNFAIIATAAAEGFSIPLDQTSLVVTPQGVMRAASAQNTDGTQDVYFSEHQLGWREATGPLETRHYDNAEFLLRGLLREDYGYYDVTLASPLGRYLERPDTHRVKVEVLDSPNGINAAQAALGRQPGVDAFKLVRTPGRAQTAAGDWVHGFADGLSVQVADVSERFLAQHDTCPISHVQSWITTPPQICQRIGQTAQRIIDTYGDRVHADDSERPSEVDAFCDGTEDLQDYTFPMFQLVSQLGVDEKDNDYMLDMIRNEIGRSKSDGSLPINKPGIFTANHTYNKQIFRQLGMLDPSSPEESMSQITAAYISHMASLLLTLEEVRPLEDETHKQRDERLAALRAAATEFAPENL